MQPSRKPFFEDFRERADVRLSDLMAIRGVRLATWAIFGVAPVLAILLALRAQSTTNLPGSTVFAFVIVAFVALLVWSFLLALVVVVRFLAERYGSPSNATTASPEPVPIGGLLWIPAVFVVLNALMMFGTVSRSMGSAMNVPGAPPAWGAPAHGPSASPVVAAIELVNFGVWLFIAVKFFQRRRYIPLLIIALALLSVVPLIGLGQALPPRVVVFKFVIAALLVSYFSLSKRVKRTFLL